MYSDNAANRWYKYSASLTGTYKVSARWTAVSGRPTDASFEITHSYGSSTVIANQTQNGSIWNDLGTFTFNGTAEVTLYSGATGTEGACADAVKFEKMEGG
jgi:hypothetical protein